MAFTKGLKFYKEEAPIEQIECIKEKFWILERWKKYFPVILYAHNRT